MDDSKVSKAISDSRALREDLMFQLESIDESDIEARHDVTEQLRALDMFDAHINKRIDELPREK